MPYKLSVFSTIVQAIKLFWLGIGKLCLWALIPALLITGVIAVVGMTRALTNNWGIQPFVEETITELFAFIISVPFFLRVNQLAILGRVMDNGYFRAIFSPRSISFLGCTLGVGLIYVASIFFSGIFIQWAGKAGLGATLFLVVKLTVVVFFFIMAAPTTLFFPIVSVEESASFSTTLESRAEELGSGNRLRLFVTIFPCWLLVTAISVCLVTAISTKVLQAIGVLDLFWPQRALGAIPLFVVLLFPVSIMQVQYISIALPVWLAIALPAWLAIALPVWLASDISMEMIYRSFSFYPFQQALDRLLITILFCTFQTWLVLLFQAAVTTIPAVAYRQLRDQPAAAS